MTKKKQVRWDPFIDEYHPLINKYKEKAFSKESYDFFIGKTGERIFNFIMSSLDKRDEDELPLDTGMLAFMMSRISNSVVTYFSMKHDKVNRMNMHEYFMEVFIKSYFRSDEDVLKMIKKGTIISD